MAGTLLLSPQVLHPVRHIHKPLVIYPHTPEIHKAGSDYLDLHRLIEY
jgi:hypothetical protein